MAMLRTQPSTCRRLAAAAAAIGLGACAAAGGPLAGSGAGVGVDASAGDATTVGPEAAAPSSSSSSSGSLGGVSPFQGAQDDGGAPTEAGAQPACTDAGCSCIRIASIGHEGIYGACGGMDGTSALETWLDTQSTATVDVYGKKPTLTPAFLAPYNVILLQWLRDDSPDSGEGPLWQFSQDEIDALAAWVQAGGGLITLSGFDGDGQEVVPLNALLSFTAVDYNMDGVFGSNCNSCWGGACSLSGWDPASPIGAHLTQVGLDFGRSISARPDAGASFVVDCPCSSGSNDCAVHQDIGKGHVFAFADEWVTYTSQWLGVSQCIAASCAGQTTNVDFQVPQFWYNAIKYAASGVQCFVIQNPAIVQ